MQRNRAHFRVLHLDDDLVAIEKPAGFFVHPPEDLNHSAPPHRNCLHLLKEQLGQYLYPVHRLDRATSGVLLYALTPESARALARQFEERLLHKTYVLVCRGYTEPAGTFVQPIDGKDAHTDYVTVGHLELPIANRRYPSSRFSLVLAYPRTGRMHQLRRHFTSASHPLIGDTVHGAGEHNRIFREALGVEGLKLRAHAIEFLHPRTQAPMRLRARWDKRWHPTFDRFGVCPL